MCEVAVSLWRNIVMPDRITDDCIKTSRNEYKFRIEFICDWHDDALEGGNVIAVAHFVLVPWNIYIETFTSTLADHRIVAVIRFREEFTVLVTMQRNVQHFTTVFEEPLRSIAMMDVPIDD